MTMKIKAQLIKRLRTDRLWSQDELAKISGVGLRTIQRIENEGQASAETIKAIASVFEIDSASLLDDGSVPYKNTQLGEPLIFIFVALTIVGIFLFEKDQISIGVFTLLGLSCLVPMIFLSTLTVSVDNEKIAWHFGPKLWKKSMQLNQVNKTRIVRNKLWWGFGVRFYGGGWLYNISGLDAVELQLKDGSRIRIGTDEPTELQSAISDGMLGLL